jgi:redox-sensing transcriptional repressor
MRLAAKKPVPDIVVGRLPVYLRALSHLQEEGRSLTSSKELAQRLGIGAAQIRRDLSHFGEFGKQGTGYDVTYLAAVLRRILKVDREWGMALVGAGDLGTAISQYVGFQARGFRVVCVFDNDPEKIGGRLGELEVYGMELLQSTIQRMGIQVAIVAVPASHAQAVVDELVGAGIKAILSYAPITVAVPPGVGVQYLDPVVHLQRMTFHLE